MPFSQLTSFEWTVLIAGHFLLEMKKKNLLNRLAGNSAGQIQSYPSNGFDIITTMIVQNTIFTTYFVPIDSFDSWTFLLGEAEKTC